MTLDIKHINHANTPPPTDAIVRLIEYIGEDPARDGLRDTPDRVLRAWAELTSGYKQDPADLLGKTFEEPHDQMIVLKDIEFVSTCEHHLMAFLGTATVAYIPGKVVGISKLARLVDMYARRLQIQERMTNEIAQAVQEHLQPVGVGVIIKARHMCMGCRGVQKPAAEMITSCMLGALREQPEARAELLALAVRL